MYRYPSPFTGIMFLRIVANGKIANGEGCLYSVKDYATSIIFYVVFVIYIGCKNMIWPGLDSLLYKLSVEMHHE